MNDNSLIIKNKKNNIGWIILNRPEKANAYTTSMLRSFEKCLDEMEQDSAIRVVIIRARGKSFCGGADLGELRARFAEDALNLYSARLFTRLSSFPRPTIAAVHGPAVAGGFELALACDFRMATKEATFALPEVGLGILPAAGGIERLTRLLGGARARLCILAGRRISAQEALQWGLVSDLVSEGSFDEELMRFGLALAAQNPLTLRLAKTAIECVERRVEVQDHILVSQALLYQLAREARKV